MLAKFHSRDPISIVLTSFLTFCLKQNSTVLPQKSENWTNLLKNHDYEKAAQMDLNWFQSWFTALTGPQTSKLNYRKLISVLKSVNELFVRLFLWPHIMMKWP